ncbi:lipoprotein [Vibrio alginolyticus]|uniref:lipoprotein n=1 Tax=Vibrio alginolyticus TaxID=663 RepID=UPI001BD33D51|nr:lipoprotein [Vibrio alginolyticus]MBS9935819.1 membrane lipoprotein lipid attachment site-containing protein [Vibrio alginolyticus]
MKKLVFVALSALTLSACSSAPHTYSGYADFSCYGISSIGSYERDVTIDVVGDKLMVNCNDAVANNYIVMTPDNVDSTIEALSKFMLINEQKQRSVVLGNVADGTGGMFDTQYRSERAKDGLIYLSHSTIANTVAYDRNAANKLLELARDVKNGIYPTYSN